jgi:hypothetical protein
MRGILISEGVTVDRDFLFLFLEDVGGTEGGTGERRADGRAGTGVGTERRWLAGRRWSLNNLCLDDAQNLPDLTTNRGDDHRNLVEEITSITCIGQARVSVARFGEITGRSAGTRVRPRNVEMVKVEVGTTFRTVWRWRRVQCGGRIDRWNQSDLNDI